MHRTVRKKDSDLIQPRRNVVRQTTAGTASRENDRSYRPGHHRCLVSRHFNVVAHAIQAVISSNREHDCERLVRTPLAIAQPGNRRLVARIANQVIAANTLHGNDVPCPYLFDRAFKGPGCVVDCIVILLFETHLRTTRCASHRLRMKSPVCRVQVFSFAGGTQRKSGHARIWAIVGQRFDQRVARTALRTVDERVGMAAV